MHFIIESNVLIIQWHNLIENNSEITIHDALCAYIILTLNKHFFSTTEFGSKEFIFNSNFKYD